MKCFECGAEMKSTRGVHKYTESGLDNVTLQDIEIRRCPSCGDEAYSIPNMGGLHRAIALALAGRHARLSGQELRFLRKYLGHSSTDFAKLLGKTKETISRWENGSRKPSVSMERFIRLMVFNEQPATHYPLEELSDVMEEPKKRPILRMSEGASGWVPHMAAA